jgi:uncharacterized protein YkwD
MFSARIPRFHVFLRVASIAVGLATLVAMFGLPQGPARAGGGNSWNNPERCFMKKINKARARHGLRRLQADHDLGYVAMRHARRMASKESMWEQGDLGSKITNWKTLGQNTGMGGKCRHLFRSFMESSPHQANVLGDYKYFGIGAKWRNNRLYVQQIFEFKKNPGNIYN